MVSNRVKERIGVNKVSRVVEGLWECGWQEYGQQNDDAIDGIVLMRRGTKRPTDTGGVVFVQVKCGGEGYRQDQKQYPNHIGISLGKEYIDLHMPRWHRLPGPAVLVFVDDTLDRENPPAWWVDLKSQDSISPTNAGMVLISKSNKFNHHSKSDFQKLCGSGSIDRELTNLRLTREENFIPKLGKTESLRDDAWDYYKKWRSENDARTSPVLGEILINRVGWKHITRRGRPAERIVQSWSLLGAAKAMVAHCNDFYTLGHVKEVRFPDGNTMIRDFLGLRANIIFDYRHSCVAQVVLQRSRLLCPSDANRQRQKIHFYSIYETRRGRVLP